MLNRLVVAPRRGLLAASATFDRPLSIQFVSSPAQMMPMT